MPSLGHFRLALKLIVLSILIPSPAALWAEETLLSLLPSSGADAPWIRVGDLREFDRENLYDYIDGAEAAYREYGFVKVVTAEYRISAHEGASAVLDIYDMGSPLGAFGIYSVERSPDYNFLKIGVQGYLEGGALNFWKGSYYIKITSFEESDIANEFLLSLAREVEGKIRDAREEPIQVKLFPSHGLVPNSAIYYPGSLLGHSFLGAGFTAFYMIEEKEYKAFIAEMENLTLAGDAFLRLREHYNSTGQAKDGAVSEASSSFAGDDPFYGAVVSFHEGRFVGGALGPDEPSARGIARSLLDNVKK